MELSEKSRVILEAIAEGHSYEQILNGRIAQTYNEIFRAAAEALDMVHQEKSGKSYDERMAEIREMNPRAYQPWSDEEDARLAERFRSAASIKEIALEFQRQPSAIRSRLTKLNLVTPK